MPLDTRVDDTQHHDLGLTGNFGRITSFNPGDHVIFDPINAQFSLNSNHAVTGISETLKSFVTDIGGVLKKRSSRRYTLSFPDAPKSPLAFSGDLPDLKKYLKSLRQPLLSFNGKNDSSRFLTHKMLRYAATASSIIPSADFGDLHHDGCDECGDKQNDMRTQNMWVDAAEIDIHDETEFRSHVDHSHDHSCGHTHCNDHHHSHAHHDHSHHHSHDHGHVHSNGDGCDHEHSHADPSLLPGSYLDKDRGFVLRLGKHMFEYRDEDDHKAQNALKDMFWDSLSDITDGAYTKDNTSIREIALTPAQFQKFCEHQKHINAVCSIRDDETLDNLSKVTNAVEQEERIISAIHRIQHRADHIEHSEYLAKIAKSVTQNNAAEKTKQLSLATSALTSVLNSDALQQAWAHYFYTERNNAPMESVSHDFEIFQKTLQNLNKDGQITPAQLDAVVNDRQFHGMLAFAAKTSELLESALDDKTLNEQQRQLKNIYANMRDVFTTASSANVLVGDHHLNETHQEIIDVLERMTGQGDGAFMRIGSEFIDNSIDFFSDLYSVPLQSTRNAIIFSAVAGYTISLMNYEQMLSDTSQAISATLAEPSTTNTAASLPSPTTDTITGFDFLGDTDGKITDYVITEDVDPNACTWANNGCHWHYTAFGAYKDYIGDTVEDTAKGLTSLSHMLTVQAPLNYAFDLPLNESPQFIEGADTVIEKGTAFFRIANLIQNFGGHIPMFSGLTTMAVNHGPRSITNLVEYFYGFYNALRVAHHERPIVPWAMGAGFIGDQTDFVKHAVDWTGFLQNTPNDLQSTGIALAIIGASLGSLYRRKGESPSDVAEKLGMNAMLMMGLDALQNQASIPAQDILQFLDPEMPQDVQNIEINLANALGRKAEHHKISNLIESAHLGQVITQAGMPNHIELNNDTLPELLVHLYKFKTVMDLAPQVLGADRKNYQNFVKRKINALIDGLKDYQKGAIEDAQLQEIFTHDFQDICGAEVYLRGQANILASVNVDVNEKAFRRLHRHGSQQQGERNRIENIHDHNHAITDKHNALAEFTRKRNTTSRAPINNQSIGAIVANELNDGVELAQRSGEILVHNVKKAANYTWDGVMTKTLRPLQNGFHAMPAKKPIALAFMGAGIGATFLNTIGQTESETLNALSQHPITEGLAKAFGWVVGGGTLGASATIVNVGDDQIGVHAIGGLGCIAGGAAIWAGDQAIRKPSSSYAYQQWQKHKPTLAFS